MDMQLSLEGKTALVTGGSRGIGRSLALTLAELGADVALTYASSVDAANEVRKEIESKENRTNASHADAVNTAKGEGLIADITEEWEKLDILINNAGITRDNLILRMSEEEWDQVIDTNLKSVFNYSKAVAKPMMRNRGGSIVNISSVVGISGN